MKIDPTEKRRLAAEDRAALRAELASQQDAGSRLAVFDVLAKQADDPAEDVPPMPDGLRDRLVEKFGNGTAKPAPGPKRPAPEMPGYFSRLREFFQQKQVAYGGLAVAACALLLFAVLPRGGGDGAGGGSNIDTLRGGGGVATADEIEVYLFPEDKSAPVVALMNPERPATLCRDAADLAERLKGSGGAVAVAADLERRVVITYRGSEATAEAPVDGGDATDVLIEIRTALDAAAERGD